MKKIIVCILIVVAIFSLPFVAPRDIIGKAKRGYILATQPVRRLGEKYEQFKKDKFEKSIENGGNGRYYDFNPFSW